MHTHTVLGQINLLSAEQFSTELEALRESLIAAIIESAHKLRHLLGGPSLGAGEELFFELRSRCS